MMFLHFFFLKGIRHSNMEGRRRCRYGRKKGNGELIKNGRVMDKLMFVCFNVTKGLGFRLRRWGALYFSSEAFEGET